MKTLSSELKAELSRIIFLTLGIVLFAGIYYAPPLPDAVDPMGENFALTREAKGALAIFFLAGIWWIFEVVPIGITSLTIGVLQVLFLIRPAKSAFNDFMDPSVMFIFASIMIGLVFTKTGLTKRLAYKMLCIVGERTSMIYLGCFVVTVTLTHFMAHTAVAATIYPLLLSIYHLYGENEEPTKFGKGLFIGMAYVAGAGSIITLLGSARGAVAISFFNDIAGRNVSFFELSYYMFPVGWIMTFIIWGFIMVFFKPEKKVIPGLKKRAKQLNADIGPLKMQEILTLIIVFGCISLMMMISFIPMLQPINKTAIILISSVLFFVFKILDINDLETIPWNIVLLFAGAMSIGFCLWETGAARWLAINWLALFHDAHWFVFIMSFAFLVMIMTNFIMNVAAIAITLPIVLVIAPYLNVAPEIVLFSSLVVAGMPFLLLVGAAPNAIAYGSRQFTSGEFFRYGIPASFILLVVLALVMTILWPLMGMPITLP